MTKTLGLGQPFTNLHQRDHVGVILRAGGETRSTGTAAIGITSSDGRLDALSELPLALLRRFLLPRRATAGGRVTANRRTLRSRPCKLALGLRTLARKARRDSAADAAAAAGNNNDLAVEFSHGGLPCSMICS
jgi:hypothetical protein